MYAVEADYTLKNKSAHALTELFITERLPLERITIENARLVSYDSIYGTYLFQYHTPLQPNDSLRYTFELKKEVKGYDTDNSIVNNGSYINRMSNFEPILGYTTGFEIKDASERKKRNLPKREEIEDSDEHITLEDVKHEKIRFETIISTSSEQIAISSGQLIKQWTADNRNYFHYKTNKNILPEVGYLSADYATKKTNYKGVSIEQYYDENHEFNIEEIDNSVKQTLDYCQENFGIYNFDHVRIAEVPSYWPFGGFAHPGVISMVENRLYLKNVSNDEDFNLVAKRVIHEVSHQWWAHTLSAKPVPGGSLFVEGFAKYTEAVVLEKMYGKGVLYALTEDVRRRYFRGRTYTNVLEPPVYKVAGQNYISYGKSLTVMLGLKDLIGEDQVNNIMKTLTDKYRSINKLEITSIEFLKEIYKNTPKEQHELVNDWFKKVITYDLKIEESSSYKALDNGTFEVTIQVKAERFETVSNGDTRPINIDEPIKIGVFTKHPSLVKSETSMLHYQSHRINKEITEIKIIVDEKPVYISIDPYGTRLDENLVDNLMMF
jgi:predicted Zn-dependent protease